MKRFLHLFPKSSIATLAALSSTATVASSCVRTSKPLATIATSPLLGAPYSVSLAIRDQYRHQSSTGASLNPTAIKKTKGMPAIKFTAYTVFYVISKHDPRLRGRQGPQLTAILYNKYSRLWGNELAGYKRTAAKLNRFKSLATQRLILSSIVMKKFGVENFRRIYPKSTFTAVSAQNVVKRLLAATQPATAKAKVRKVKKSIRSVKKVSGTKGKKLRATNKLASGGRRGKN